MVYGLVDEDEPISEPSDRTFWEKKRGSKATLVIVDHLLQLINEVEPGATLNYNKHYIGLEVNGSVMNFVSFNARKVHLIMNIRLGQTKEIDDLLEEAGIDTMPYRTQSRRYRLRLESTPDTKQREVLRQLVQQS